MDLLVAQLSMNKAALKTVRKLSSWMGKRQQGLAQTLRDQLCDYISQVRQKRQKPTKKGQARRKPKDSQLHGDSSEPSVNLEQPLTQREEE